MPLQSGFRAPCRSLTLSVPACCAGSGALGAVDHDQKKVFQWALGWSRAGGDAVARGGAAHTALAGLSPTPHPSY